LAEYTKGLGPSFIPLNTKDAASGVAFFQLQKKLQTGSTVSFVEDKDDKDLKRAIDTITLAAVHGTRVDVSSPQDATIRARIQGASPNFVVVEGSQGSGVGTGSPDGGPTLENVSPKPIPPSSFGDCGRLPPRHTGATVYVLDTGLMGIPGAAEKLQQPGTWPIAACLCPQLSNCQNQPLVGDLGNGVPALTMGGFTTGTEAFQYTRKYRDASWLKYHGLAVAELIHYHAPDAQIIVVPVLNQYGVGDLQALLAGLHAVQADAASSQKDPSDKQELSKVLINMSLSIEPPTRCIFDIWEHGSRSTKDQTTTIDPSACDSSSVLADVKAKQNHSRLIRPLSDFVQAMTDNGFTLVAAAGNDSTTSGTRPQFGADFPAVLCGVVSVAATTNTTDARNWQTGSDSQTGRKIPLLNTSDGPYYSPDGSKTSPDPCLNGDASQKQPTGKSGDARVAYALGSKVCSIDMDAPNGGMGLWSGTSFAAALTSGNLARTILEQGGSTKNTSPYDQVTNFSEEQPCG
jgi:Subtilase family